MIHIKEAIIVEGKYDKEKLKKITDAPIICTNGFDLYRSPQLMNSIRFLAKRNGIIILTVSDSSGFRIRNYIKTCVGKEGSVKHAYIPAVKGKEKRKEQAGKEGLLGVEGMSEEILLDILSKLTSVSTSDSPERPNIEITKKTLFDDGFIGKENSSQLRKKLLIELGLPAKLSTSAMLDIINKAGLQEEYLNFISKLRNNK